MSRVTKQLKKLSLSSLLGDGRGSEKDDVHLKKLHHHDGKKKLPTIPTREEQSSMKQSIRMRSPINTDHLTAYGPFFLEYSMLAEFNHLRKQRLPGVYAIPSSENPLVWHGVIFVRMGIYQDGIFRFKLNIPANYPDGDCPHGVIFVRMGIYQDGIFRFKLNIPANYPDGDCKTVVFMQSIFHPSVHPETAELDVKNAFKTWRPNVNHLWQILLYVRRIFYKIESSSPMNSEAAHLFENNQEEFKERAKNDVEQSHKDIYKFGAETDDPHEIRFTEWNPDIHDEIHTQLLGEKENERCDFTKEEDDDDVAQDFEPKPNLSGLSFMEPGSVVIFSKEDHQR